ncbi:MAG TPA: hypothetical protein VHZ55_33180 [Bryobacteraceae bacterium]|jgi:hypothetical protein|nr:hypothetical protein [Bryobacteraceae bacterium]
MTRLRAKLKTGKVLGDLNGNIKEEMRETQERYGEDIEYFEVEDTEYGTVEKLAVDGTPLKSA